VDKYAGDHKYSEHDQGEHPEKEPGGAAEGLIGGLGDAECSEKPGGKRLEKSHCLMVRAGGKGRGWRPGG
jgi:hypothetical protein